MRVSKKMLYLLSYATAKSDWTRENAAKQLGISEDEAEVIMRQAQSIEYWEDSKPTIPTAIEV